MINAIISILKIFNAYIKILEEQGLNPEDIKEYFDVIFENIDVNTFIPYFNLIPDQYINNIKLFNILLINDKNLFKMLKMIS